MRAAHVLALLLLAGPAAAQDAPMATAGATGVAPGVVASAEPAPAPPAPPMSTAQQIDAFLQSSPARALPPEDAVDGVTRRDRQIHGSVSVGVGTGGYRSVYVQSEMPLGSSGRLSLAFGDARYGRGGPGAYGPLGPLDFAGRGACVVEGERHARSLATLDDGPLGCR